MADRSKKPRASSATPALQPSVVLPPPKAAESMTLLPGIVDELASAELAELPLEEIQIRHRVRELNEEKLGDLSYSIKKDGLLQPLVVAMFEGEHVLIAGQHRLEVCRRLRWPSIPVRLIANIRDQDHLIRLELSENLFRNELSLLERAVHLAEYLKRDSALSALSAEQIADTVNISRRTFFYYKQVAELKPELVQRILKLPQDIKNSRSQLLDFYNLPDEQMQESVITALEGNPDTTYKAAKGAVTKLAVESGVIERPLTITQVTRSRVQELKQVRREYYSYTGVTMTDLVDFCLELGLEQLKRQGYKVDVPLLGLDGKQLEGPELWAEMTPSES